MFLLFAHRLQRSAGSSHQSKQTIPSLELISSLALVCCRAIKPLHCISQNEGDSHAKSPPEDDYIFELVHKTLTSDAF